MTNPCNDILRKNGLTPDEQNLIEIMSRQGDNTPAIRENFFKAIEDAEFDKNSAMIREKRTSAYLEVLEDIVLKGKNS